ncbi:MAG: C-terminal helicase domain-containing protein, partial [Planctomycetes bacterium]|nr:C-terminal helicase domain-containing protein [Planctomycetota bacterium]
ATPGREGTGEYELAIFKSAGKAPLTARSQIALLNFNGRDNLALGGRSPTDIPPFDAASVAPRFAGQTEAMQAYIVASVRQDYLGLDVTILSTSEGAVDDGSMTLIHFGTFDPGLLGVAEGVDEFNERPAQHAIVFTNTKHAARKVAKRLVDAGISAKEIHGDLLQNKRDWVMDLFRKHKMRVLVATDLAARGIDVSAVTHIINYDVPFDSEVYIHRIGRTARMGARGTAYTFVTPEEGKQITEIEKLINLELREKRFDGFVPRSQPEPAPRRDSPAPSSTAGAQPATVGAASPATVTKKLGGKFRPRRRRRL